jgi:hypothetical protein
VPPGGDQALAFVIKKTCAMIASDRVGRQNDPPAFYIGDGTVCLKQNIDTIVSFEVARDFRQPTTCVSYFVILKILQ